MQHIIISIKDYDLPGFWEIAVAEVFIGLNIIKVQIIFMVLTLTSSALEKSHLFFPGCSPS